MAVELIEGKGKYNLILSIKIQNNLIAELKQNYDSDDCDEVDDARKPGVISTDDESKSKGLSKARSLEGEMPLEESCGFEMCLESRLWMPQTMTKDLNSFTL